MRKEITMKKSKLIWSSILFAALLLVCCIPAGKAYAEEKISEIKISGLQAPQIGAAKQTASEFSVPEGAHYAVTDVYIATDDPDHDTVPFDGYKGGHIYYLFISIKADEEYMFEEYPSLTVTDNTGWDTVKVSIGSLRTNGWIICRKTFPGTVKFDANGGLFADGTAQKEVNDSPVEEYMVDKPVRDGYSFKYWMYADGTEAFINDVYPSDGETVYAKWKKTMTDEPEFVGTVWWSQTVPTISDPLTGAAGVCGKSFIEVPSRTNPGARISVDDSDIREAWYKSDDGISWSAMTSSERPVSGKYYRVTVEVDSPGASVFQNSVKIYYNDAVLADEPAVEKTGVSLKELHKIRMTMVFDPQYNLIYDNTVSSAQSPSDPSVTVESVIANSFKPGNQLAVVLDESKIPEGKEFAGWKVTPSGAASSLTETRTIVTFGDSDIEIKPIFQDKKPADDPKEDPKDDPDKKPDKPNKSDKPNKPGKNDKNKTATTSPATADTADAMSFVWIMLASVFAIILGKKRFAK